MRRSDRLRRVFECLGRGLSNKEIAEEIGMSERAVKSQISALMRRFSLLGPGDNRRLIVRAAKKQWRVKRSAHGNQIPYNLRTAERLRMDLR